MPTRGNETAFSFTESFNLQQSSAGVLLQQ